MYVALICFGFHYNKFYNEILRIVKVIMHNILCCGANEGVYLPVTSAYGCFAANWGGLQAHWRHSKYEVLKTNCRL